MAPTSFPVSREIPWKHNTIYHDIPLQDASKGNEYSGKSQKKNYELSVYFIISPNHLGKPLLLIYYLMVVFGQPEEYDREHQPKVSA